MDTTRMDLESLKAYEAALDTFITNIKRRCGTMRGGITSAKSYMKDPTSTTILKKSEDAVQEIEDCLPAASRILEIVRNEIHHLSNTPDLGI